MTKNMNCADVAEQARQMVAAMGDKIDGIEWEADGRVFSVHRDRPNEVVEYTGEELARYRALRAEYERRHGIRLVDKQEHAFCVGERWYSFNNGNSWTRQQIALASSSAALTVVKIDRARGEITLSAAK
jgi:hypothetical protein